MRPRPWSFVAVGLAAGLWPGVAAAQRVPTPARSEAGRHVADYRIDARYDPRTHTVEGTEVVTFHNRTTLQLDRFPFHLYLNAFQPRSTWVRELRRESPGFRWDDRHLGGIETTSVTAAGEPDLKLDGGPLTPQYVQPDDHNTEDHTVADLVIPAPLPPGASVSFTIGFRAKLPEILARTGHDGDFVLGGQWFPKLAAHWNGDWSVHQFHYLTEFFADFGAYDVRLTVPASYVVGATGEEVERTPGPDGTVTVRYRADDVHDFAWTADPRFQVFEESVPLGAGPLKVRLLMQPAHAAQAARHLAIIRSAVQRLEEMLGPYPYRTLTVVDPPRGSRAASMEYPTLVTGGTGLFAPDGARDLERVLVHEIGHQYFYASIANDEVEDAWLDEGVDSFVEMKVLDGLYGPDRSLLSFAGLTGGEHGHQHTLYLTCPDADPIAQKGYRFLDRASFQAVTYAKTAAMLASLESVVGEEGVRRSLRTYAERYRFAHPHPEDFFGVIEEVTGKGVHAFAAQTIHSTQVLDYAVDPPTSEPLPPGLPGVAGDARFRSTVVVRRKGELTLPVIVQVTFEDGEKEREDWEGEKRWARYAYDKPSRVASVEVDPDHQVLLDADLFNNGYAVAPDRTASRRLGNLALFFTELLEGLLGFFA